MSDVETPCAKCPRYAETGKFFGSGYGVCRHPDGPIKVRATIMFPWDDPKSYPAGCPVDPSPPAPPRRRPKMNKKRVGRTPRANADEWKNGRAE